MPQPTTVDNGTQSISPTSIGGTSSFELVSANTNNASTIKTSAGLIYGYEIYNTNASVRYVKLYNKATNPAPASDNALLIRVIGVPPAGRASFHSINGLGGFTNGIALAAVTGISNTDNTSVGANDLVINIDWA